MRLRVRVYAPALSLMAPCLVRCAGGIIISITVVYHQRPGGLYHDFTLRRLLDNFETTLGQFFILVQRWDNFRDKIGTT